MIILLGLVLLIAAIVFGVTGIATNIGASHSIGNSFSIFGYHVSGSSGTLFLYGIVVGGVAILGLATLLAGARRLQRRSHDARGGLKESRRLMNAVAHERDSLAKRHQEAVAQRADARVEAAQAKTRAEAAARERDNLADQRQDTAALAEDSRVQAANARAEAAEARAEAAVRERKELDEQHRHEDTKQTADARVEAANARAKDAEARAEAAARERKELAEQHQDTISQTADARVEAAEAKTRADMEARERDNLADRDEDTKEAENARVEAANARANEAEARAEAAVRERNNLADQRVEDIKAQTAEAPVEAPVEAPKADAADAGTAEADVRPGAPIRTSASDRPPSRQPGSAPREAKPAVSAASARRRRGTDRWGHLAGRSGGHRHT